MANAADIPNRCPGNVLVMEDNPLIAEDISATVVDVLGFCRITTVGDLGGMRAALEEGGHYALAVISASTSELRQAKLDHALVDGACGVVVIGDQTEGDRPLVLWPEWSFVSRPFTTPSLGRAIARAAADGRKGRAGT